MISPTTLRDCVSRSAGSSGKRPEPLNLVAWNPGANSNIYALWAEGGTVYVGGSFSSIGGKPRPGFAIFDP